MAMEGSWEYQDVNVTGEPSDHWTDESLSSLCKPIHTLESDPDTTNI